MTEPASSTIEGSILSPLSIDGISSEKMKVLALLLGDPNPIHFDINAVRELKVADQVVNQGPSSIALIYNLIETNYPNSHVRKLSVRLSGNVLAGDSVDASGTVTNVCADSGDTVVTADVSLAVAGRGTVISGAAEIVVGGQLST
ncbi:MaoC family dehydratase [Rhodococcus koreensis]